MTGGYGWLSHQCRHELLSDAWVEFATSLYLDRTVMRFIPMNRTEQQIRTSLVNSARLNRLADTNQLLWVIVEKQSQRPVGIHMLSVDNSDTKLAEYGIMLSPESQHNGIGTESIKGLLAHIPREWGIEQVFAQYQVGNHAMARVFQKAGFTTVDEQKNDSGNATLVRTEYRLKW